MSATVKTDASTATAIPEPARCPVDHTAYYSHQKTARDVEQPGPAVERDAAGVWHVRGFEEARQVLRGSDTRQAGFKAELMEKMPGNQNRPVLYQEGKAHLQQRKQTARFFTPTATSANYRALMEALTDELITDFTAKGRADLSQVSMRMAVRVASEVVGLTSSRRPGIDRRLDAFFSGDIGVLGWSPRALAGLINNNLRMFAFFFFDVQPAIRARRKRARGSSPYSLITRAISASSAPLRNSAAVWPDWLMRMSSGPSLEKEKPRSAWSSCIEETPMSSAMPSTGSSSHVASARSIWLKRSSINVNLASGTSDGPAAIASGSRSKPITRPAPASSSAWV